MPESAQYWLLIDDVPSGPFTVKQIHDKLASGEITWQTPTCPLGGGGWLPLVQTPGIGPGVIAVSDPNARAQTTAASLAPTPPAKEKSTSNASLCNEPKPAGPPTPSPSFAQTAKGVMFGLLPLFIIGVIVWNADCAKDANKRVQFSNSRSSDAGKGTLPAEYREFMRDGKIVPTGHANLDHWVHINVFLETLKAVFQNDLMLPSTFRILAKGFRERPTTGVDSDLVQWTAAVTAYLDAHADIVERINNPATLRHATEEVSAGRPDPIQALKQNMADLERERGQLIAEGRSLQEILSKRYARKFPPPQL